MIAKYKRISEDLKNQILEGNFKIGSAIPSEQQLQVDYCVSRYTVRQAISLLINEGFLSSERGSGTFVNDWVKLSTTKQNKKDPIVGVILTSLSDYIFPEIIRGIEKTLRENSCIMLLSSSNNDFAQEKECLLSLYNQGIDALIMEPSKSNCYNPNIADYMRIQNAGIPIYFINSRLDLIDIPTVSIGDVSSSKQLTETLFNSYTGDVAIITNLDFRQGRDRLEGFIKAHAESQKELDETQIFCLSNKDKTKEIESIIESLKETPSITSLICYNDEIAIEYIKIVKEKYPEFLDRIAIASFDYSDIGKSYPITFSVEHPKFYLGVEVADRLLRLLRNMESSTPESYFFEAKIIKN